jgi:hypothetical protein
MSANVERAYKIQCVVRRVKKTCHCIMNPKPEDDFCAHNCDKVLPLIYDIKKLEEKQARVGFLRIESTG